MTDNNKNDEKRVKAIFQEAQKASLESDPFMKTRVLAELRIAKEKKRGLFWKSLAFASPVAVAAALLLVFFFSTPSFKASVNSNVLVKVEIKEIKSQIAYAEIDLPTGVQFYSSSYPEIALDRSLVLAIDDDFINGHIPIVIKSEETGTKKIKVNLLDQDKRTIEKRFIKINFTSHT